MMRKRRERGIVRENRRIGKIIIDVIFQYSLFSFLKSFFLIFFFLSFFSFAFFSFFSFLSILFIIFF